MACQNWMHDDGSLVESWMMIIDHWIHYHDGVTWSDSQLSDHSIQECQNWMHDDGSLVESWVMIIDHWIHYHDAVTWSDSQLSDHSRRWPWHEPTLGAFLALSEERASGTWCFEWQWRAAPAVHGDGTSWLLPALAASSPTCDHAAYSSESGWRLGLHIWDMVWLSKP